MKAIDTNLDKHKNYALLHVKMNKAIKYGFYLEATFIAYSILEDRSESILVYLKKFDESKRPTLTQKIRKIHNNITLINKKYTKQIKTSLIESILVWKDERNRLIHNLSNLSCTETEMEYLARQGSHLCRKLSDASKIIKQKSLNN